MEESRLKWPQAVWVVLCVVLAAGSAWAGRTSRKQSAPAPSRSAPSRPSSAASSAPRTPSSYSARSVPSAPRPSISRSGSTEGRSGALNSRSQGLGQTGSASGRISRRAGSEYGTILNRNRTSNDNTRLPRQSDSGSSGRTGIGLDGRRDLRKSPSLPSDGRPVVGPDRDFRKDGGHVGYPYGDRSFYYYDRHYYPSRPIFSWISWPDCCRPICYDYGPHCTFGFFWPYYHRKFIFISLGGYWPCYTYRRYYWYGWHPYEWYGPCPPEYVKLGDTYNYYYYNAPPAKSPDANDLEQAGKKLEESPPAGPQERTQADRYFEEGVKAFEGGNYAAAAAKFGAAMELAPDDIVLPFAYVQAVFAQGEYESAAEALREVMAKTAVQSAAKEPPETEGVFYPRGLYPADDALQEQIKHLKEKVTQDPLDADLQLLLGYQLLGVGRLDEAAKPLADARLDYNNHQAATVLLNLLEKLKKADEGSRPTGAQPRN